MRSIYSCYCIITFSLSDNLINLDFGIHSELDVFMCRYVFYYINPKYTSYKPIYTCTLAKHGNTNIFFVLSVSECLFIDLYPKLVLCNLFMLKCLQILF